MRSADDPDGSSNPLISRRLFGVAAGAAVLSVSVDQIARALLPEAAHATLAGRSPTSNDTNPGQIAAAKGLYFGSAISNTPFRDADYRALYAKYCNILVHGSALQWHETQLQPGQPYDFARAEAMYQWAHGAGKAMRGHAMLDWAGLPPWLEPAIAAATPSQVATMLRQHVTAYATHWKGRFIQWNVANEPIGNGMRRYGWFNKLGEQYLDLAFATAHEIDPATPLALNQNLVEMNGWWQQRELGTLLGLVQRLKSRGVPIKSVGIEGHLQSGQGVNQAGLDQFCKALAQLGVTFMVTEFDIDDRQFPGDPSLRDAACASLARDFFDVTLSQPNCEGLIVWDMSDRENWLTRVPAKARPDKLSQRPALLDDQYRPKPVWQEALNALRRAPGHMGASNLSRSA